MSARGFIDFGKCPYVTAQKLLDGKWSIVILHYLNDSEHLRFSELQKKMPNVTHATLSSQLKLLETQGLITRTVYPEVPPRVEYSLTEIGREFSPVLSCIGEWGNKYIAYMEQHPEYVRG